MAAFPQLRRHVLLPFAGDLRAAGSRLAAPVRAALPAAVDEVPEAWLAGEGRFPDAATHREAYVEHLSARLDAAAWEEDAERARASVVRALHPGADLEAIGAALATFPRIARGGEGSGPIGRLSTRERFHWLVAPRSTVVQVGPVHSGICDEPAASLERLVAGMVRPPGHPG